MKRLIIWDFDGVIADSEKLWVKVWCDLLKKEKNIVLNKEEKLKLLVGVAGRTKKHNLQRYFPGTTFDNDFMEKISEGEYYAGNHFMKPIEGVEKVFADKNFEHCIATGSTKEQLDWKISIFKWIGDYVGPKDRFTVDMVEHGKPAPDVFLLVFTLVPSSIGGPDGFGGITTGSSPPQAANDNAQAKRKISCLVFIVADVFVIS